MNKSEKPLKSYRVSFKNDTLGGCTFLAHSPAAARYQFWRYLDSGWDYKEYLYAFKVECLGYADPTHLFEDKETFDEVCRKRGIDFAYQGMEVRIEGRLGIIVGAGNGLNLKVLFHGSNRPATCHPFWETTYYNQLGEVVKCFKEKNPELLTSAP